MDPIFQFHRTHFARAVVGLFVGLGWKHPAAPPDPLTPTNSGNFLHLGLSAGAADTIAPNGILVSLLLLRKLDAGLVPGSDSFGDPAAQYRENRPADMKDDSEPNSKSETLASVECKNGIFDIFKNHSILKLSSMTIPRVEASWPKVSYKSVVGRFNLVFNPWSLLAGCSCCFGSTSSSLYRKLIKVTSD